MPPDSLTGKPVAVDPLLTSALALAGQGENLVPSASQVPGRMDVCGHNTHVTCLVGAALLARVALNMAGDLV